MFNKISKPKKHRSVAGEVEQGRGGGGRVDEEVDPVGVRAGQDQGGAGLVLQLREETMNIFLFKGDDHSEVGGQGEGFVGGRVGSEHPEQVTLVQLGHVFAPIHDEILLLPI